MTFLRGALFGLLLASAVTAQNFVPLFDGKSLDGWFIVNKQGPGFFAHDGLLICPANGGQKLMTEKEYANFIFQFEFRLEADANNGIGIRAPRVGQTSKAGMEIQILDQTGPLYGPQKLKRLARVVAENLDYVPVRDAIDVRRVIREMLVSAWANGAECGIHHRAVRRWWVETDFFRRAICPP